MKSLRLFFLPFALIFFHSINISSQCAIEDVIVDFDNCGEEDMFTVHINFAFENVGANGFSVVGNGMDHGDFNYEDLPVQIGPLPGDCETVWEFVVIDNDFEECSDFAVLGEICCGTSNECSITEVVADATDCNEEDHFNVLINFTFENVGENGFTVHGNGMDHGTFNYEDLPVEIGPLNGDCETPWEFVVRDVDFEVCSAFTELGQICCGSAEECSISEVVADPTGCNENDMFLVSLSFNYSNVGNEGFSVLGNGIDHGDFNYEDLPITIGPLPGNCETPWEFVVIDNQFEGCSAFTDLGQICCGAECSINELTVTTGSNCNAAGEYEVTIDFVHEGTSGVGFDLFANGEFFGFYGYDEIPLTIVEFPSSGEPFDEITVCDNDSETCCATIAFPSPCACTIGEITLDIGECNDNGQFEVIIDFEYSNTSEWFTVGGNGMNYGNFMYSELPVNLGLFDGDGTTEYEFVVVDLESELCFNFAELGIVDCETTGDCSIFDLVVEPYECDNEGQFLVDLDFQFQNVGENGFVVHGNGNEYGPFSYEDLFITLGPFDGDCETIWEFAVSDVDFPDCGTAIGLDPICCGEECNITNITVDPGECTGDGVFSLVVNFDYSNVNSTLFDVYSGDDYVGFYAYDDLPITIEEFPERVNSDFDIITICDSDSETCCETLEFEGPNCSETGSGCEIGELLLDVTECNDNNQFSVLLNFEYVNAGNSGFSVVGNGNDYGDFEYESLPIELGPFDGNCESVYEFVVIDNEFENCANDGAIDPVCCGEPCQISNIEVTPGDCTGDGLFSIILDFDYVNNTNEFFDVYAGDDLIGFYSYTDLPVTIEEFPERTNSDYDIITICDNDNEACCATEEFMGPDCAIGNDCEIGPLNLDPTACNDEGQFNIFINFEYANVGENGFTVHGNGNDYGTFEYESLPIELGPFSGDCESVYEFIVRDVDFEDCASDGAIEAVCCGDECSISNIQIDPGECTGEGLFSIVLNFDHQNTTNDFFDVFSGDDFVGFYAYADLPVTIEEFPERTNSDYDIITICDNDNESCCATEEFMGPDCTDDPEVCEIGTLFLDGSECNDNGQFVVILNFEYANVGENGFSVLGNGTDYGDFEYTSLPIELGPFEGDCESVYEFIVIDNDFEDCAEDGAIEAVCCDEGEFITEMEVQTVECTGEGLFSLWLMFQHNTTNKTHFDVYAMGEMVGSYKYEDLPVFIEEFPEFVEGEMDQITVCDDESEIRCGTLNFPGLDCTESTSLNELDENKFAYYYNPFDQSLYINLGTKTDSQIQLSLLDINGKRLQSSNIEIGQSELYWNINEMAQGIYLLNLNEKGNSRTFKVLIL